MESKQGKMPKAEHLDAHSPTLEFIPRRVNWNIVQLKSYTVERYYNTVKSFGVMVDFGFWNSPLRVIPGPLVELSTTSANSL